MVPFAPTHQFYLLVILAVHLMVGNLDDKASPCWWALALHLYEESLPINTFQKRRVSSAAAETTVVPSGLWKKKGNKFSDDSETVHYIKDLWSCKYLVKVGHKCFQKQICVKKNYFNVSLSTIRKEIQLFKISQPFWLRKKPRHKKTLVLRRNRSWKHSNHRKISYFQTSRQQMA